MNTLTKLTVIFAVILMTGLSTFEGNTVSIGESFDDVDSSQIPIYFQCDQDLSMLAFTVRFGKDVDVQNVDIECNQDRLPWKKRGVITSVNTDTNEMTFTVADLMGQNVMVTKGEGVLITVSVDGASGILEENAISVHNIRASELKGEVVNLK